MMARRSERSRAASSIGLRSRRVGAGKHEVLVRAGLALPMDEVFLEVEPSFGGQHRVRTGSSLIGSTRVAYSESSAQMSRDLAQRRALGKAPSALHMRGQIAVAQPEPTFAPQALERLHEGPGFIAPSPAPDRIGQSRQGVHHGIQVGARVQRPRCRKSSPVLTTIVSSSGGSASARPWASLAPPTPPQSATTWPLTGKDPAPAGE